MIHVCVSLFHCKAPSPHFLTNRDVSLLLGRTGKGSSGCSSLLNLLSGQVLGCFQILQELADTISCTNVHVSLGALQVIVQVASEGDELINDIVSILLFDVSLGQAHADESPFLQLISVIWLGGLDSLLQLQRLLTLSKVDRWCIAQCSVLLGILQLLQKGLCHDNIISINKVNRINNDQSLLIAYNINVLISSVWNSDWIKLFTLLELVKHVNKWSHHDISLEQWNNFKVLLCNTRVGMMIIVGEVVM